MPLRLLVAAGGTGGHFFPAVAVVQAAERIGPVEVYFAGRQDRIEGRFAPMLGWRFVALPVAPFSKGHALRFIAGMAKSLRLLTQLVRQLRPDVVLTTGAYIGLPAGVVAGLRRIPLVLVEVNVLPGRAVRLLARGARVIVTAYEETAQWLPKSVHSRIQLYGVPVRQEFRNPPSAEEARRRLGLEPERPVVAVLGGSLGAARLNAVAQRLLPAVESGQFQLIWQHGERWTVPRKLPAGVVAQPFFSEPAVVLAAADCIIARAGGMTVAELCSVGRAAVLVPYPGAVEQHQEANARWMERNDAAVCVADTRAEQEVPAIVQQLLSNTAARQQMAARARQLARPDAAERIAAVLWELHSSKGKAFLARP
ncbi:MAG: UDP-N-acetylglucosamine--N-acetylmuramyl-(pentapeptide) pyrophosphoryl-undecaprenol N-acetylglucosamine transferase [Chlorobiota bacterium]